MLVFHAKDRAGARIQDHFANPAAPRKNLDLIDEPTMLTLQFHLQNLSWNRLQRQGQYPGERKRLSMFIGLPRLVMIASAAATPRPACVRLGRGEPAATAAGQGGGDRDAWLTLYPAPAKLTQR